MCNSSLSSIPAFFLSILVDILILGIKISSKCTICTICTKRVEARHRIGRRREVDRSFAVHQIHALWAKEGRPTQRKSERFKGRHRAPPVSPVIQDSKPKIATHSTLLKLPLNPTPQPQALPPDASSGAHSTLPTHPEVTAACVVFPFRPHMQYRNRLIQPDCHESERSRGLLSPPHRLSDFHPGTAFRARRHRTLELA